MNLEELRASARTAGTSLRNSLKKGIAKGVWISVGVVLALWFVIGVATWKLSPAAPAVATTPPARYVNVSAPAEILYDQNTDKNCTGMQRVQSLTEEEREFNPFGCYVYWKHGVVGTVTLVGVTFIGLPVTRDITAGNTDPAAWTFYKARAKVGTGRAAWQPILCVGPKQNLNTNNCA